MQVNRVSGPQREGGCNDHFEIWPWLPPADSWRHSEALVKLEARIYVIAVVTGRRILECFYNSHIKQKLNQGLDGKIYVMKDRETSFIIALKNPTTICILEQPGMFLTHGHCE